MLTPMRTLRARVNRGAKLLDEQNPGWARKIKRIILDMNNCGKCILGQLYGSFWEGRLSLGLHDSCDYGFNVADFSPNSGALQEFSRLGDLWHEQIRARLNPPKC